MWVVELLFQFLTGISLGILFSAFVLAMKSSIWKIDFSYNGTLRKRSCRLFLLAVVSITSIILRSMISLLFAVLLFTILQNIAWVLVLIHIASMLFEGLPFLSFALAISLEGNRKNFR